MPLGYFRPKAEIQYSVTVEMTPALPGRTLRESYSLSIGTFEIVQGSSIDLKELMQHLLSLGVAGLGRQNLAIEQESRAGEFSRAMAAAVRESAEPTKPIPVTDDSENRPYPAEV